MPILDSLLLFSSQGNWIDYPIKSLALTIDGWIYSLVAYAYKLFMIVAQLNMNMIIEHAEVLVDRVKAVIMVLVLFKLAISLINYLINPEKATDNAVGGAALVRKIIITVVMLISYEFVFALFNDISALIIGYSENGHTFQVIQPEGGDEGGLLARLVFGVNSDDNISEFGSQIAAYTFQQFLKPNGTGTSEYNQVFQKAQQESDFAQVAELADDVGKTVRYEYPVISAIVGAFLIYSIVKMSLDIAVRMFKLVVLQIVAPIAIISYIDPNTERGVWKNYIKAYMTTYTDAFIRILALFVTTAFISLVVTNVKSFFTTLVSQSQGDSPGLEEALIIIIVIVAGYRFAMLLPKFISSIFGFDFNSESKSSFGKTMAAIGGFAAGGIAGLATGITSGINSGAGKLGIFANALAGGVGGALGGMKGNTIAEQIKNIGANNERNRNRALNYARMGGFGQAMLTGVERRLGIQGAQAQRIQRQNENTKALENMVNARSAALSGQDFTYTHRDAYGNIQKDAQGNAITDQIKFGSSADDFANRMLEYDDDVLRAQAAYESSKSQADFIAYRDAKAAATKEYKAIYENNMFNNGTVNSDANVIEASKVYDKRASNGYKVSDLKTGSAGASQAATQSRRSGSQGTGSGGGGGATFTTISSAKKKYSGNVSNISTKGATQRANRPNIYGGGS